MREVYFDMEFIHPLAGPVVQPPLKQKKWMLKWIVPLVAMLDDVAFKGGQMLKGERSMYLRAIGPTARYF